MCGAFVHRVTVMSYVLVVDDDPLLGELVGYKLEAVGYEVLIVEDGAAALAAIHARIPDVLVLDSMMPIMSGPEVLLELKKYSQTANIPVIMLTARKGQEDVVTALRAGAADYLTKPFMPDELALRIARILDQVNDGSHNARSA
jgi:DNA-binding response OmpR family regulator